MNINFLQNVSLVLYFAIIVYCSRNKFTFWLWSNIGVSGIFLDISKAFDKMWYEGILFKLKTYGVNGEVLILLTNYLHERYQSVVLKGQTSSWELVKSGGLKDLYLAVYSFWYT